MPAQDPAKIGVLVINLGTPDDTSVPAVRRFLKEFLSDPAVIDLPAPMRWLLLHAVILPFRPKRSAEAYREIWEPEGSPLLLRTLEFTTALGTTLGGDYEVATGMRYGNPSIRAATEELLAKGVDRIVALPLYAQATASSTGSTITEVERVLAELEHTPELTLIPEFHEDEGYLAAMLEQLRPALPGADQLLFCFHGIPERHVLEADRPGGRCLEDPDCCATFSSANAHCYRAQCLETARRLASALDTDIPWTVAFQSRLGRTPWLSPYADQLIEDMAGRGIKKLVVVPGSFLCDCLENLEELGLRARESFLTGGGEEFRLVPALNAHPSWVSAAARLVESHAQARAVEAD